jgi:N-acetylneuraminic acid mutarotase
MIVWGGSPASGDWYGLANGGRYDPATDTWTATSGVNAPLARLYHTAVWTGRGMLVWGGASIHDPNTYLQAGARYVPATDTWSTLEGAAYAPSARSYHSAVWTGREMIVWGGETIGAVQANTGGRFVAGTSTVDTTKRDVLVAMDKDSAGLPSARADFVAVWTGQEMVVWGGREENGYVNTGGRYNPVIDTWLPTSTAGAVPDARMYVTAVWTGREMIVWGGENLETGGRYNPMTDSWTATSLTGAPLGRTQHSAVWTGRRMLIWGGARSDGGFNFRNDGGAYDPATDTWEALGTGGETPAARGGGSDPRPGRGRHGAVWTGREMIVWGGTGGSFTTISSGDRYDPQTGTWSKVLEDGSQPAGRTFFTPLWTGREMIVWSGPDAGGRYDPEADTWTPISTAGAPAGVYNAAMVWAGGEMIVWGGLDADYAATNAGARYDPATDRWAAIGAQAPMLSPRHKHRAVWTGSEMLIWGGADALDNGEYGDGARYVP